MRAVILESKKMPKSIQLILTIILQVLQQGNYSFFTSSNNRGTAVAKQRPIEEKKFTKTSFFGDSNLKPCALF